QLDDRSLVPGDHPRIGAIRFEDWFSHASLQRQ
ncbi:MAG: NmrA family transcriptional regulator, partial [Mesorhizobium sp.]